MSSLLLELFSEEIPARMQGKAITDLRDAIEAALKAQNLAFSNIEYFVTPRRLTLHVEGLPLKQQDRSEEKRGPRVDAPQAAIDGFLKSTGLQLSQLEKRAEGKGEFYYAVIQQKGRDTADVLKDIVEESIRALPWPKSMRWGSGQERWVRPLKRIVALFDGKVLPVSYAGISASNLSEGHRFLAPGTFEVKDFAQYHAELEKRNVMLCGTMRKDKIRKDADDLAAKAGVKRIDDEALIEEVAGLVEWPVVLQGSIDTQFMHVPQECLISSIRANQKYLCTQDANGKLSPVFFVVSNMEATDGGKQIVAGNERVLRARLSDAKFFFEQDQKHTLESRLPKLSQIIFHAKIGTVAERVKRIEAITAELTKHIPGIDAATAQEAAKLCKADLVTEMVGEFPELQGIMGGYYAPNAKVGAAIRDHYKPLGPNDDLPSTPEAVAVALADKLDALCGLFAVDEKPTGSKDPFALRRAALGIIRIIREKNLDIPSFNKLISVILQTNYTLKNITTVRDEIVSFVEDRLKAALKTEGFRHDYINAVLNPKPLDNILNQVSAISALSSLLETTEGKNLLAGYKRAANILAAEEKKGTNITTTIDSAALKEAEEKMLHTALANAAGAEALIAKADYAGAMKQLAQLRAPIDAFFEKVTVNADDAALRQNRLALLASVRTVMHQVADFSVIEG